MSKLNHALTSFYGETQISLEIKKQNYLNYCQILTNRTKDAKKLLKYVMYVLKGLQTDELNETKEETTSHQDLEKLNHYIEETSKLDKENLALIAEIEQIKCEHQHIKVLIDNFATQKLKPKRKETKRKGVTFGRTQTFAPIKRKTVF